MNSEVSSVLHKELLGHGAALVGYANLDELDPMIRNNLQYGISVAVAMTPSVVRNISKGVTLEYHNEYKELNALLEKTVKVGCKVLASFGYEAVGQTTTVYTQNGSYRTALPHKTIATRAGLGWIGKCALLVTESYGSAVRLGSILTNAPLQVGIPINTSKCFQCNQCASACIGQAVKGINWDITKDRDSFFDANACRTAAREKAAKIGLDGAFCGKCIEVCPYTQRYINK